MLSTEIQCASGYRAIPFYVKGDAASDDKSLAQYANRVARTVTLAQRGSEPDPPEGKVLVSVARRSRDKVIAIDPGYLKPWEPVVEGEVLVIRGGLKGIRGMVKARVGDRWVVTFTVDDEAQDREFVERDIIGLERQKR